jgi:site-specific recombinase XerC
VVEEQPVTPHTIYHSFATHLLDGGAGILRISHLLGHMDFKTTAMCTHVDTKHLHEAYQRYHPRPHAVCVPFHLSWQCRGDCMYNINPTTTL